MFQICPVCESEIEISDKEVKFSSWQRAKTGGKVLVSCPECCRVLELPADIPEDSMMLNEWLLEEEKNNDWCPCPGPLNPEEGKLPAGVVDNQGKKQYRAGEGGPLYDKRTYMYREGINPECMWKRMGHGSVKPFVTGDKQ